MDTDPKIMVVERLLEEGYEIVELSLPAVVTVVKEINEPRMPSLKGKMRAKAAQVPVWTNKELEIDPAQIGLTGSPTQVVKIFTPAQKQGGKVFTGEAEDTAAQLLEEIKDIL